MRYISIARTGKVIMYALNPFSISLFIMIVDIDIHYCNGYRMHKALELRDMTQPMSSTCQSNCIPRRKFNYFKTTLISSRLDRTDFPSG